MKVVGVDVGGTKILCRLVDSKTGKAQGRVKMPTPKSGPADVVAAIVELVNELDPEGKAVAVGAGFPGYVRPDGVVVQCANIVGWDRPIDVGPQLEAALGKPVAVGNDVSVGALAEHRFGAGNGHDDLLTVFVGTGVGGGVILDGKIRSGPRGLAGEIGHTTVVPGGRPCGCGGSGHLEAYAGKAGIEREARRLAASGQPSLLVETIQTGSLKSRHLAQAVEAGDPVTIQLMIDATDALALAIGNVTTMLDISQVVLGGGVVDKLGKTLLNQIHASSSFGGVGSNGIELCLAQRMGDAGSLGAALLAADQMEAS